MVYLITGVAGFIGSHIAEELIKDKDNTVVGIDNFYSGFKSNIDLLNESATGDFYFLEGDIRDREFLNSIFDKFDIEYIFHQAGIVSVQLSMEDPLLTGDVNLGGMLNLLDIGSKSGVKKILFASSAAVYGDEPSLPKSEESELCPISPYGLEKLVCEQYMKLYSELFNIKCAALRYFNVFGERQNPNSAYSGVISIFNKKISEGNSIIIYGDGEQYRDFIYIKDVVKSNIEIMKKETGQFDVYCIGGSTTTSINDLVNFIGKKYDNTPLVSYEESRSGDIVGSVCDNKKMMAILDEYQLTDIQKGLISI
jgi:UDP-glucose 4-epimerase